MTITAKQALMGIGLCSGLLFLPGVIPHPSAQDSNTRLRLNVDLVQLNVAVTDKKGDYITGLRPDDFKVDEDKIPEKIATFEEGNQFVNTLGPAADAATAHVDQDKVGPAPAAAPQQTAPVAPPAALAQLCPDPRAQ